MIQILYHKKQAPAGTGTQKPCWCICLKPVHNETKEIASCVWIDVKSFFHFLYLFGEESYLVS